MREKLDELGSRRHYAKYAIKIIWGLDVFPGVECIKIKRKRIPWGLDVFPGVKCYEETFRGLDVFPGVN